MTYKNRPQYIEKQLQEINKIFRAERLKFDGRYDDTLFMWFTNHLLKHGWYRGFNMYVDRTVVNPHTGIEHEEIVHAGLDYEKKDYYIQIN